MHRSETLDSGGMVAGEIVWGLSDSDVVLKRGGVVLQRGTNHAWANRSDRICRKLFVLVDGHCDTDL